MIYLVSEIETKRPIVCFFEFEDAVEYAKRDIARFHIQAAARLKVAA